MQDTTLSIIPELFQNLWTHNAEIKTFLGKGDPWNVFKSDALKHLKAYEMQPSLLTNKQLLTSLRIALEQLKKEHQQAQLKLKLHVAEQYHDLKHQVNSNAIQKIKNFFLKNIKYFFESDPDSLIKKYSNISKNRKNTIRELSQYIKQLSEESKQYDLSEIITLNLAGDHHSMGIEYGKNLKNQLHIVLNILKSYFIDHMKTSYSNLLQQAEAFFARYSFAYASFLTGIAEGSGLSLEDCKILNAMETLHAQSSMPFNDLTTQCAFLFIPPNKTVGQHALIGRNYDYPAPFDQIAQYLVVTVLHETDRQPVAIVALPGQIYCPSCIGASGVFVELNNGGPSGGWTHDVQKKSLLIHLLEFLQNSDSYDQFRRQLAAVRSDYSLIINTADAQETHSFEYSSLNGMKSFTPIQGDYFASTNYFLNQTWAQPSEITDHTTWNGVTRRKNLLSLAHFHEPHNITTVKNIMDTPIDHGGATWNLTIYQMIVDTEHLILYLKSPIYQKTWTKIALKPLFLEQIESKRSTDCSVGTIIVSSIGSALVGALAVFGLFRCQKRKPQVAHTEHLETALSSMH